MEQLVLLLVIGAISLINWLIQKSAEHKQQRGDSPPVDSRRERPTPRMERGPLPPSIPDEPAPSPPPEMRRLFEALGIPLEEAPPPPPPRVTLPFAPEPPPLPVAARPAPVRPTPAHPAPRRGATVSDEFRALAERFSKSSDAATAQISGPSMGNPSDLAGALSSPEALRKAIILREILGPPRSLDPAA